MTKKIEKVLVLGASNNPERYSNKATKLLLQFGHLPILVNPRFDNQFIEERKCYATIEKATAEIGMGMIDTLTVYVNPQHSTSLSNSIISLAPKRVIFNPGSENPDLQKKLLDKGIEVLEACTLVMLNTEQF